MTIARADFICCLEPAARKIPYSICHKSPCIDEPGGTQMKSQRKTFVCQICKKEKRMGEVVPAELVRDSVIETIRKSYPDWSAGGYVCIPDLNRFRAEHVKGETRCSLSFHPPRGRASRSISPRFCPERRRRSTGSPPVSGPNGTRASGGTTRSCGRCRGRPPAPIPR